MDLEECCCEEQEAQTQPTSVTFDPYSFGVNTVLGTVLPSSTTPTPAEMTIMDVILDMMDNKKFNPGRGSVSVARLQDAVAKRLLQSALRHECLLQCVLRHRTFAGFLAAQQGTFAIVFPESSKKRVRCVHHPDWERADQRKVAERSRVNAHVDRALREYLHQERRPACSVAAFQAAYPALSCNQGVRRDRAVALPKPGDLVRLVRQWHHFEYDPKEKLIRLLPAPFRPGPKVPREAP
eukprot:EG_transcript_21232